MCGGNNNWKHDSSCWQGHCQQQQRLRRTNTRPWPAQLHRARARDDIGGVGDGGATCSVLTELTAASSTTPPLAGTYLTVAGSSSGGNAFRATDWRRLEKCIAYWRRHLGARLPRAQWFKGEGNKKKWLTNLVKYFGVRFWQCHRFLEDLPDSVETLALGPIVEGACHINLFGMVRPTIRI